MSNDPLSYPMRQYGMDHTRYDWSMLTDRKAVQWPQGKTLALWVNINLQFFPLNPTGQPVKVPGNMSMPYPDLRHYSLRDYGNRVGIYRILDVLDRCAVNPTVAINTRLAERYPALLKTITGRGDEILAHSWSMDTAHAGGLELEQEAKLVSDSLSRLRELSQQDIRGWLSPGKQQSANTPELIREHGIDYVCDWVNDDMPYRFNTNNGGLWSMPLSTELEDRFVLMDNLHCASSWAEQITDACDFLLKESQEQGGRILALNLHPWVIGQPHRIKYLAQALEHITAQNGVWSATAGDILDAFTAQQ
ncbi:MAG: polysaccharide deacetylase family protein [Oceanococcus sp.]